MTISFDSSEIRALAADLTKAGASIDGKILPIITKGAVGIKNQMRAEMGASTHFKGTAPAINFSIHGGQMFGVGVIEAEVGAKIGSGETGGLAHIAYFGTSRGGGTVADPQGALDAELPRFQSALEKIAGDIF